MSSVGDLARRIEFQKDNMRFTASLAKLEHCYQAGCLYAEQLPSPALRTFALVGLEHVYRDEKRRFDNA